MINGHRFGPEDGSGCEGADLYLAWHLRHQWEICH